MATQPKTTQEWIKASRGSLEVAKGKLRRNGLLEDLELQQLFTRAEDALNMLEYSMTDEELEIA